MNDRYIQKLAIMVLQSATEASDRMTSMLKRKLANEPNKLNQRLAMFGVDYYIHNTVDYLIVNNAASVDENVILQYMPDRMGYERLSQELQMNGSTGAEMSELMMFRQDGLQSLATDVENAARNMLAQQSGQSIHQE